MNFLNDHSENVWSWLSFFLFLYYIFFDFNRDENERNLIK